MRPRHVHRLILVTVMVWATVWANETSETGAHIAEATSPVDWAQPIGVTVGDAHRGGGGGGGWSERNARIHRSRRRHSSS